MGWLVLVALVWLIVSRELSSESRARREERRRMLEGGVLRVPRQRVGE